MITQGSQYKYANVAGVDISGDIIPKQIADGKTNHPLRIEDLAFLYECCKSFIGDYREGAWTAGFFSDYKRLDRGRELLLKIANDLAKCGEDVYGGAHEDYVEAPYFNSHRWSVRFKYLDIASGTNPIRPMGLNYFRRDQIRPRTTAAADIRHQYTYFQDVYYLENAPTPTLRDIRRLYQVFQELRLAAFTCPDFPESLDETYCDYSYATSIKYSEDDPIERYSGFGTQTFNGHIEYPEAFGFLFRPSCAPAYYNSHSRYGRQILKLSVSNLALDMGFRHIDESKKLLAYIYWRVSIPGQEARLVGQGVLADCVNGRIVIPDEYLTAEYIENTILKGFCGVDLPAESDLTSPRETYSVRFLGIDSMKCFFKVPVDGGPETNSLNWKTY